MALTSPGTRPAQRPPTPTAGAGRDPCRHPGEARRGVGRRGVYGHPEVFPR